MHRVYHTAPASHVNAPAQSNPRYPRHARITAWMIKHLTNGERLVAEGLRFALKDHETIVVTSATIARWANVSESTVSRALPGLQRKGIITAERVVCAETGRRRWHITLLPPPDDANRQPLIRPDVSRPGSVLDVAQHTDILAIGLPHTRDSESSMTDPSNIQDSCTCMQQHAAAPQPPGDSVRISTHSDACSHAQSTDISGRIAVAAPLSADPADRPDLIFPEAWRAIRAANPTYTLQDFARDMAKAHTRRDIRNPVGLVVGCATRNEPVYSRTEVQVRLPPTDHQLQRQPAVQPLRPRRMQPSRARALPNTAYTTADEVHARQIAARARAIAPPGADDMAIQCIALDLEAGADVATALHNVYARPAQGGGVCE